MEKTKEGGGALAPPLVADRIAKAYSDGETPIPVIAELSLTLEAGKIVSIVGPSGCGKTTMLNVLSAFFHRVAVRSGGTVSHSRACRTGLATCCRKTFCFHGERPPPMYAWA